MKKDNNPVVCIGNTVVVNVGALDPDTAYVFDLLEHRLGIKMTLEGKMTIGLLSCQEKSFDAHGNEI